MPSPSPSHNDLTSTLPREIIEEIFVHVEKGMKRRNLGHAEFGAVFRELHSFLQVCRRWRAPAERRLYSSIFFDLHELSTKGVSGTKFLWRCEQLLRTLQENEGLALHVHELVLLGQLPTIRTGYGKTAVLDDQMDAMTHIVNKCGNLKHFETDGHEDHYITRLSGAIEKKKGLHALIVPAPRTRQYDRRESPKPFCEPEKLLELLENFSEIREVVVWSFCARRSVSTATDLVAHNSPYHFFRWYAHYHLHASFLRSFLVTWKGPLEEFRVCLVHNNVDTYAAMNEFLALRGQHLKVLGLVGQHDEDTEPCSSLTKSISELVKLESLDTNSMIVQPTALSSLASLRFLKYEFNLLADLKLFAEMIEPTGDSFLPEVTAVDLCSYVPEQESQSEEARPLIERITEHFETRGVCIAGNLQQHWENHVL